MFKLQLIVTGQFLKTIYSPGKCLSIGLGSGFSEVRTTKPFLLMSGSACIYVTEDTGAHMAVQYRSAFLGPEETFGIMVRGVFQVQERANNGRIFDFFFLIQLRRK